MRYLLNSAVIPGPGVYRYRLVTVEEARSWFRDGEAPASFIGYPESAEALGEILGSEVAVNRTLASLGAGDEALVFRLTVRIPPGEKGKVGEAVLAGNFELGIETRIE